MFTIEQKAELKDLYSPETGWAGIREMAKYFGVGNMVITYEVNYKNCREEIKRRSYEWRKKNPEKTKEMVRKASIKHYFKIKDTPEYKNNSRIASKKHYYKMKKDPIRWAKYSRKTRIRQRKWYYKKYV